MSYFKFDKSILRNTQRAITMELFDANKFGAYASTTVIGCNTRKYHGLLIIPIKSLDSEQHVLLSSLDESVVINGGQFKLSVHQYANNKFEPSGNKYACFFNYEKIPSLIYRVGQYLLSKEFLLSTSENRIFVKYTMLDGPQNMRIRISPNLAFRNVNALCQANYNVTSTLKKVANGISTCLYSGYPNLVMQTSSPSSFVEKPDWNRGVEYYKEQWRGYNYKEDLYIPGYFETDIPKGQSVILSAGTDEADVASLSILFDKELSKKPMNDSVKNTLKNSIEKLSFKSDTKTYLKAGAPWFNFRARDMMVSLPGISLPFDDKKAFASDAKLLSATVADFISGKGNNSPLKDFDNPDILLWYIRALQCFCQKYGEHETWVEYGDELRKIIEFFRNGKHPLTEIHENGLLYVKGGWQRPLTWMNATSPGGQPITPRSGYVIEINALWYNALIFMAHLASFVNDDDYASQMNKIAENIRSNFSNIFWNGTYLYDFVDNDHKEMSVRPNMIFAVSLPYSPLDEIQKKMVVDMVTKELLTPKGLRSLSPKSQNYHGWSGGDQVTRDYEAFQGSVYPWLMSSYVDAYIKVYGNSGIDFVQRCMASFASELSQGCLGTMSEMYDATQPFTGRGGMSFLMNLAEVAHAMEAIDEFTKQTQTLSVN